MSRQIGANFEALSGGNLDSAGSVKEDVSLIGFSRAMTKETFEVVIYFCNRE